MKTRLSLALAFLLMVVQGLWAQTPMTPADENTWTAPMPAYQILLHADYWGEFAISYDLDGGVNHAENPSLYYEDETVTLKTPTKENYIFTGWTGSNGNEPQLEVSITQGSTGDKSFVAHWNEIPTPDPQQDPTIFAGFTATAGCDGFGGEDHSKLVDGLFAPGNEGVDWTKWCADGQHKSVPSGESESCWWVDFNAANPIAVTGYILTTGNDNTQWGEGRNPNSWKIKAKLNAGDAWTTIATVTNDNTMQVADFTDFTFDLDQAGTYKYFRFMVYEPEYDNCMQLCEFRFTGNGGSTPEPPTKNELLQELWTALGEDVWTGYGVNTGVISYSRGGAEAFHASFMGGNYAFDLPFAAFTEASKAANTDGSYTYTLTCNLPAQTGMGQETLHVTLKNGEITELESENAGIEMNKEEEISGWVSLQNAFAQGGVIKLAADVADLNNEGALVVPAGKTVMLELNGHTINRNLTEAVENGSVIINNGTLAVMDTLGGKIIGGKTTGNGGGILNNGVLTLYGGEITGNVAALGGGVYNNGGEQGFWMTGGLIKGNTATTSNPAIGGEVIFNAQAVVQINADGDKVSIAEALASLATLAYVQPAMPNYDDLQPADPEALKNELLQELWTALGEDVWTGYGVNTGVISYSRGGAEAFHASFMGGNYAFDLPFAAFTAASKAANTDGSYTYTLTCNLPAQTGMGQETLHVTLKNGEITELESENAGIEMNKEEEISGWVSLQNAFAQGGVIKLAADVADSNNEGALVVPAGKTVMLELNGHIINRALTSAVSDGSVIINNGTLAIMDTEGGKIIGGKTTGNGGGILNNGVLTLYGGEITGNVAALGGGVYNNGGEQGFWMTGGLIKGNTATTSHPAIGGEVIFNAQAVVQINADGDKVSIAEALASLATLAYVQPAMPNYDDLQPADPEALKNELLQELWTALGEDVWTGYGVNTGVISYSRGGAEAFHASFMGGNYAFDLPFAAFTEASKAANTDGSYTYTLTCNLPAQTGMGQETLHVTLKNGEITELESENAGIEMNKEEEISGWASLQNAFAQGGVIKLAADVADLNSEGALVVPAGKTVMLELNGHIINRALTSAVADGSVIINNGTLAIMDTEGGKIIGGKTTGNGGGVLNNGILTLYGGEITGNVAALGGGVYNNGGEQGFWMTGGLIKGNTATTSNPAIGGEVIFNAQAVVQINADGDKVSIAEALASLATLAYVQPAMPNYDDLQPADPEALKNELLQELWTALGEDVWTGYGVNTGVISYSRGGAEAFHASFMGGNYAFDLPFAAFTAASKAANTDGSYTYTLTCNLPAQTGMGQETLHVTLKNGEITELESENAGVEMNKEEGPVTGWAALQAAMNNGGVIKLGENVTAESTDAALVVPAGKTVVLELNGFNINRNLNAAVENGSVIINNGTLAIMANGVITGGKTTGNGGGVLNNGIFTLYGGEITGNAAAIGGGVYNNGGAQGFWMTGGLIDGNTATTSNPAIGGAVIFNENAAVQIDAQGTQVTIAQALAGLETYSYIKPVMPNYEELETDYTLLLELYNALGNDVWTGYGVNTGVISYSRGDEPNSFKASFMGGTYSFDLPFEAFTEVSKADNGDGTHTYTLVVNLPAQTGMGQETLHVTTNANGEITDMDSENAGIEMQKEEGPVTGWAALQAAMNNGGVIKLGENVTAESTDAALEVPAGKTVVLELNGFNINRALTSAVENGSVIINNGTLAIMGEGQITGGKTTGNGGGVLNNGIFTLYAGEITGNAAALGGGVYNNGGAQGFWMTGGLIDGNDANSYPAIGGDVIFNAQAVVQINADGDKVSIAEALASLATLAYVQPAMPNYDDLQPADPEALKNELLQELWTALGEDVWTGYGVNTGVISYSRGGAEAFHASFMGGNYAFDLPFAAFTEASKAANTDGSYTYTLTCNLPAQTGMGQETLHVTTNANGEIIEMESENAGIELQKETDSTIATWSDLQEALNNGGLIKLTHDIEGGNAPLEIPAGKTVVLDLNGHTIDRGMTSAAANGSVIVNNGTLAIVDNSDLANGVITGGKTTGNGGGVLNNSTFTLYGGEITGNAAAIGGGVYNNGGEQGFWMTGGLIDGNDANSYPAIGGDVIFNAQAVVQINADGDKVSIAEALASLATLAYVQPAMPNYDDLQPADPEALKNELLQELWTALGEDVWTGYGVNTGVISYSRGGAEAFHASFMGGNYAFDLPFAAFTEASKAANTDGSYTYTLTCNLPAQTGMGQETLHVTLKNGEITELESENAGIEMNKEEEISGWAALQAAMTQGGVIKLAADVADSNNEGALVVPAGKTVMLELNGHIINRALTSAVSDGSVIINNGTLAIMDTEGGKIIGGKTTGNGGGILNNGVLTLYGGEITGNVAALGGGVYNNGGEQGFWMTGGLIKGNTATTSHPAIGGEVIFNAQAVVQINADGDKVSIAEALASLATLAYVQPAMPNYDDLQPADPEALKNELLQELWTALGEDVWTGYGVNTGVISYSRGGAETFHASFMGGNYAFDLPFAAFTEASKAANTDGSYTYTLTCNLPAQTGMGQETLHVTLKNGEITGLESENAGVEMNKEEGPVTGWAALQAAMNNGGVIKLGENVIAESTDAALVVPAGKTVVLELNGFNINRNLANAVENGSVIINNGTLAIMGDGKIMGGKTTGNGGGVLNNGIFTLYGGEITGNVAALGGGVYNNGGAQGFWMTGGLIDGNTATTSNPAIGGAVIFNENAAVQIDAQGTQVTIAQALAGLETYSYIKPVMPNYEELETDYTLLLELYNALGNDVWTGYGVNTGVISYSRGDEPNSFKASFMGGTYSFDLPFEAFTEVSKADNGDGTHTYTLVVNLPAQTGMGQETLHVTTNANGEITNMDSENAGIEMQKEEGPVTGWAALQAAMNNGGVIKLGENVTAESTDAALEVPAGKTVVLELNGFNINRNLTSAVENGSVIINNGTLAIMGEGQITGGKTTGNGGGVLNNGIFTLYGGEITGNVAALGGGIYNNGGEQGFWMTGGLIDGNDANSYPAIGGDVIFNNMAVVQIDAQGATVSIADAIAGLATYDYIKPVMPDYEDIPTEVAITANADPENPTLYYSTFFDSANKYMLPAGVEAYVADLSGDDLVLTKIAGAGQVIPANEAVILKASVANFNLKPSFEAPANVPTNNDLEGVDVATPLADLSIDKEQCYVLSGSTQYGVGFYKINATMLKAHKAYVIYNGSLNNAPRRMRFVFENEQIATGVDNIETTVESQKIMENGVLYIIKNGVKYNVQGQIVK